jgi:hypothetical protein
MLKMHFSNKTFFSLFAGLVLILALASCSVQKRHYQKGFYVDNWQKNPTVPQKSLVETKSTAVPDSCATIEFTDGTNIQCKIVSIGAKEVFYRYCVDDGKEHKCLKQRLKKIQYPDGKVEHFAPFTGVEIPQPIITNETNPRAQDSTTEDLSPKQQVIENSIKTQTSTCDVLILRDGSEEQVILKEIDDENIRYKLCSMPDGPDFVKKKSLVFMLKYKNGQKEIFKEQTLYTAATPDIKAPKPKTGLAIASLVLSILGIWPLSILGSILGLIFGLIYLQKNRMDPKLYPDRTVAKIGVIISAVILGIVLLAIILILSLI